MYNVVTYMTSFSILYVQCSHVYEPFMSFSILAMTRVKFKIVFPVTSFNNDEYTIMNQIFHHTCTCTTIVSTIIMISC